jgi:hypothetical protein
MKASFGILRNVLVVSVAFMSPVSFGQSNMNTYGGSANTGLGPAPTGSVYGSGQEQTATGNTPSANSNSEQQAPIINQNASIAAGPSLTQLGQAAKQGGENTEFILTAIGIGAAAAAVYNGMACSSGNGAACWRAVAYAVASGVAFSQKNVAKNRGEVGVGMVNAFSMPDYPYTNTQAGVGKMSQVPDSKEKVTAYKNAHRKLEKTVGYLKAKGVIDKKGNVVMPNGTKTPLSNVNSSTMAAGGVPKSVLDGVNKDLKKMADEAAASAGLNTNVLAGDSAGGGGGGGGGGGAGFSMPPIDETQYLVKPAAVPGGAEGANIGTGGAEVSGMQKSFNGEPIGVAQDSIWLMTNRRYNLEAMNDNLITAEVPRIPASYHSGGAVGQ